MAGTGGASKSFGYFFLAFSSNRSTCDATIHLASYFLAWDVETLMDGYRTRIASKVPGRATVIRGGLCFPVGSSAEFSGEDGGVSSGLAADNAGEEANEDAPEDPSLRVESGSIRARRCNSALHRHSVLDPDRVRLLSRLYTMGCCPICASRMSNTTTWSSTTSLKVTEWPMDSTVSSTGNVGSLNANAQYEDSSARNAASCFASIFFDLTVDLNRLNFGLAPTGSSCNVVVLVVGVPLL